MRSLAELAENYERWAAEDEVIVTAIMNNLDRFSRTKFVTSNCVKPA